jgi:hypothetical protein
MQRKLGAGAVLICALIGGHPASAQTLEHVLSLVDGLSSGATFDIRWISNDRCPAAIDNGTPTGAPPTTVVLTLDCRSAPPSLLAIADFILFDELPMTARWNVGTVAVARVDAGTQGGSTTMEIPTTGGTSLKTRLRLRAPSGIIVRMTVRLTVRPPALLPDCRPALTTAAPTFVCSADNECLSTETCSETCGQRCMPK